MLGFIIGRMVLARSVIERAVRQQLADLDLDSGDFDVAAIVEAFEASVDDEKDIQSMTEAGRAILSQSTPRSARSSPMNGAAKGWRNYGSVFT